MCIRDRASNCNEQIPAKIYEYLRANRPILALTDPLGDTAATLRHAGVGDIVRLDSASDIVEALPAFVDAIRRSKCTLLLSQFVEQPSREGLAAQLATLLYSALSK